MSNPDTLQQVVSKYKLDAPVPEKVQKAMRKAKRKTLIGVFRKHNKYSLFLFITVSVFFWFKKIGITISVLKSAIITATAAAVSAAGILTGSYYFVQKIIIPQLKDIPENNQDIKTGVSTRILKDKVITKDDKTINEKIKPSINKEIRYKLGLINFRYDKSISGIGKRISSLIKNNLTRIRGKGTIANIYTIPKSIRPSKVLTGTIIKLDQSYRITVKVINKKTLKVLLYETETAQSEKEINNACKKLSQKIAKKI